MSKAANRPTPHPDGPFAQPPDVLGDPQYDEKGLVNLPIFLACIGAVVALAALALSK